MSLNPTTLTIHASLKSGDQLPYSIVKMNTSYCTRNGLRCVLGLRMSSTSKVVNGKSLQKHSENMRFKTKLISIPTIKCYSKFDALESLISAVKSKQLVLSKSEMGIILVPKFDLVIPVNDGMIQLQHVITEEKSNENDSGDDVTSDHNVSDTDTLSVRICTFHNRASSVILDEYGQVEERPVDIERQEAMRVTLHVKN